MTVRRAGARLGAVPATAALVLLGAPSPASAHVSISASETAAGSYTVLTVAVPHGCEGSPTTRIEIRLPEEILAVTPTRNPFWTVAEKQAKLAEPVTDAHGNTVTERDAVVVYTARQPLPDGIRDTLELSLKLPEEEGATLVFPTVQTCAKGQTAWTEVAAEGQDHDDLEHPAPTVTITAAAEDEHGHGAAAEDEEQESSLGGWGLGAGVLGLAAGGAALLQVRRRS
jgi:periplasmic copper chaperone A